MHNIVFVMSLNISCNIIIIIVATVCIAVGPSLGCFLNVLYLKILAQYSIFHNALASYISL